MPKRSSTTVSPFGYIVTTWVARVVLSAAAALRPSMFSLVYGMLAIASFGLAPVFSSPFSLFGRQPKYYHIVAIVATCVSAIACLLHIIFYALVAEDTAIGSEVTWRVAGFARNDTLGDWILSIAPDVVILVTSAIWTAFTYTIQHHRIRKSWTILGSARGVTSTAFIVALIAASILRPTTLTAPLFVGLLVQVLRWSLTKTASFREPFISHDQWFGHAVYVYTCGLVILCHMWQLLPSLLEASGASEGEALRLRRVGASLGLVLLQTDAADWTVYASYVAIGLLHALSAAVSQRVLGNVQKARRQGEMYHAAKAKARYIVARNERLQAALAASQQSSPSLGPSSPHLAGKIGGVASGAASSIAGSSRRHSSRRDTDVSAWMDSSHSDRSAPLLRDANGKIGGGGAASAVSAPAGAKGSGHLPLGGGGVATVGGPRSHAVALGGGGRSASVVASSIRSTPPKPPGRILPGRNSAVAALSGVGRSPLATIGEDTRGQAGGGKEGETGAGGGSFSEHPDEHDLLEREGRRRDSSHMSSLEMPPHIRARAHSGHGVSPAPNDYDAMRRLGYRSRYDTRMSVVSVAASVASRQGSSAAGQVDYGSGVYEYEDVPTCVNCYGLLRSRSGDSIQTISGLVGELAGRVIAGRLGFSLLGVLVLGWCTTYPSLTTLPLLGWVLWTASSYSRESKFDEPRSELYFFVPYLAATAVTFYAACIFGAWRQPDAILDSVNLPGGPYDSEAPIRGEFSVVWQLSGMVPLLRPVVRLLLNFGLIMFLGLYHKVTLLYQVARETARMAGNEPGDAEETPGSRPQSPLHALVAPSSDASRVQSSATAGGGAAAFQIGADDEFGPAANPLEASVNHSPGSSPSHNGKRMSVFSSSLIGQKTGDRTKAGRAPRILKSYSTTETEASSVVSNASTYHYRTCWDISCGPGPYSVYSLLGAAVTLMRGYAFVIALTVLYVLGLSHVDLIHTGYVIIFIVFFVSSQLRRDYWRWLVIYTSLAIGFLFVWHVAAHHINPDTANTPPWVVGLVVGPDSRPLWRTTFVSNGIILVFSMIQLPQYIDEQEGVYSAYLEELMARYEWLAGGGNFVAKAMQRYGAWLCYAVYFCLSLLPYPDCLGLVTLVMLFVMLGTHLSMGVRAPIKRSSSTSAIMYLMTVMAVIYAGYLIARYVFQFGGLAKWFQESFWEQLDLQRILTVRELGLERYVDDDYAGDLYVSLLDSFAMLLLTVVQIGFLSDLGTQLARKEEFVRAARANGSVSASIRGRRGGAVRASVFEQTGLGSTGSGSEGYRQLVDQEATLEVDEADIFRSENACLRLMYSGYDYYRRIAFYHSGKLTLLLAFIVATLHDTVTGAALATGATIFAAVMTYRQDPSALDTSCLNYVLTCRCLCCCCWLCSSGSGNDGDLGDGAIADRRKSQMSAMSVERAVEIGGMPARQIRRLVDELPDPARVWQQANGSSDDDEFRTGTFGGSATGRREGGATVQAGGRGYYRRKQLRASRSLTSVLVQFFADTLAAETGRDRARTGSSVKMFAQLDAERRHAARQIAEQEGVQPDFDGYVAMDDKSSEPGSGSSSGSDGSGSSAAAARRAAAIRLEAAFSAGHGVRSGLDEATEHLLRHAAATVRLPPAPISAYRAGYMPQLLRRERIASSPRRPFRDVWLLAILYGVIMTLFSFAYQFYVFRNGTWYGESDETQWIGFYRIRSEFNGGSGNPERISYDDMWSLIVGYAIVIASCILQRWSHDYESYVMKVESIELRELERTGSLDALAMERLVDGSEVAVRQHERDAVNLLRRVGEQRIQRIKVRATGSESSGQQGGTGGGSGSLAATVPPTSSGGAAAASASRSGATPSGAGETSSSSTGEYRSEETSPSRFVSSSVESYYGKLPSIESLPPLQLSDDSDIDMQDPRLILGLAAWYDVMYNAPILHRLVAADGSESAAAIAALLDGSPRLRRSVSEAVDELDTRYYGISYAATAYYFRYGLCARDRAILSAGKHALALRARLNRHRVSMWHGMRKAFQRHSARIFNDLTAVALIVAAFCHLDIWSVILLVMAVFALLVAGDDTAAAHLFKPAQKRRLQTSHHRARADDDEDKKPASPAQSFANAAVQQHLAANVGVVRMWLWPAMTITLAAMITIRYIATVGWPPFLQSTRDTVWPWSDKETMYYYFGVGETVTGLQLLPDFIALLIASLTKRQWWTDQSAAEALLSLTAGFSRVEREQTQVHGKRLQDAAPGAPSDIAAGEAAPPPLHREDSDAAGDSLDLTVMRRQIHAEFPSLNTEDLDWLCRADATVERQQIRRFRQSAMHLYAGEVLAGALTRAFHRQQIAKTERLNRYALKIAAALQQAQRSGTDATFSVRNRRRHQRGQVHRHRSRRNIQSQIGLGPTVDAAAAAEMPRGSDGERSGLQPGLDSAATAGTPEPVATTAGGDAASSVTGGAGTYPRSVRTGASGGSGSSRDDLTYDLALAQTMASAWDWVYMKIGLLSWNVVVLVLFLVASIYQEQNIIIGGYFVFSLWFMYRPEATRSRLTSDPMFTGLRWFNMLVILLQILYQAPFIPAPEQCSTTSLCFSWQTVIGLQKFRVVTINGSEPCLSLDEVEHATLESTGSEPTGNARVLRSGIVGTLWDAPHLDISIGDLHGLTWESEQGLPKLAHGTKMSRYLQDSFLSGSTAENGTMLGSQSESSGNNQDCPSPFSAQNGILTSFVLLIFVSVQLQLYQSDAYASVRAYLSTSQHRATRRGQVWMEMEADERAHQSRSLARQQKRLRMRLTNLVRKTEKWHNLLSGDIDEEGSSFSPPSPPRDVLVDVMPDGSVRLQWSPPKGYVSAAAASEEGQGEGGPVEGLRRTAQPGPEEDGEDQADDRSSVTTTIGSERSNSGQEQSDTVVYYVIAWYRKMRVHSETAVSHSMFGYTVAKRTEPGARAAIVRGFNPAFDYRVKVAAMTEAGMGRFAEPVHVTMSDWVDGGVPAYMGDMQQAIARGERPAAFVDRRLALREVVKEKVKRIASQPRAKTRGERRASFAASSGLEAGVARVPSRTESSGDPPEIEAFEEGSCGCENGCSGFGMWILDSTIHSLHNSVDRILYPKSIIDFDKFSAGIGSVFDSLVAGPKGVEDGEVDETQQQRYPNGQADDNSSSGGIGCCGCDSRLDEEEGLSADHVDQEGPAWWSFLVCGLCGAGNSTHEELTPEEEEVGAESSDDEADCEAWYTWLDGNRSYLEDLRLAARESMALGTPGPLPSPDAVRQPAARSPSGDVDAGEEEDARLAAHSVFSDARGRGMSGADAEMLSFQGGRPRAPTIGDIRRMSIRSFATTSTGQGIGAGNGSLNAGRGFGVGDAPAGGATFGAPTGTAAGASGTDAPATVPQEASSNGSTAFAAAGSEASAAASGPRVRIADGESTVISAMPRGISAAVQDGASYPYSVGAKTLLSIFLFVRVMLSHTKALAGFILFISAVTQANFLSMAPFGVFVLVHLAAYPRPSAAQWDFVIVYLIFVLLLKFLIQLPLFCMVGAGETGSIWALRLVSDCGVNYDPPTGIIEGSGIQPLVLFGLYKYYAVYGGRGFVSSVLWDLLSLLAVILHRETLRYRGIWLDEGSTHSRSWITWLTGDSADAEYHEQFTEHDNPDVGEARTPADLSPPATGRVEEDADSSSVISHRRKPSPTPSAEQFMDEESSTQEQLTQHTTGPSIVPAGDLDLGTVETVKDTRAAGRAQQRLDTASTDDSDEDLDDIEDAGMAAGVVAQESVLSGLRRRRTIAMRDTKDGPGRKAEGRRRPDTSRVTTPTVDNRSCGSRLCCVLSCGCCCRAPTASDSEGDGSATPDGRGLDKTYTVRDMTEHLQAHRQGTLSRIDADRGLRLDNFDPHDLPLVDLILQFTWYSVTLFIWAIADYYFSTVDPDHRGGTWFWVQQGAFLHSASPSSAQNMVTKAPVLQLAVGPRMVQDASYYDGVEAEPESQQHSRLPSAQEGLGSTLMSTPSLQTDARTLGSRGAFNSKKDERLRPTKPGRDLYIWSASIQLFILLYTVIFYGAMTGGGTDISQELAQNYFSGRMVLAAILYILCIVCERLAYLWRSLLLKVLIHWASVIAVHWIVFFQTPLQTNVEFAGRSSLVVYYCLWVLYFMVGAKQIQVGYGRTPPTDSMFSHGYHWVRGMIFNIYASIPFLFELRQILDWTTASTSMDVWMWLKLAAIQSNLFRVQVDMTYRRSMKEVFNGREALPFYMKLTNGWLIVLLLLAIIIAPIIVFSTLNPVLVQNPVLHASIALQLRGFEAEGAQIGVFDLFETDTIKESRVSSNFTSGYWNNLLDNVTRGGESLDFSSDMRSQAQFIAMEPYPVQSWNIAPPALNQLVDLLGRAGNASGNATEGSLPTVVAQLDYTFTRAGPYTYETIGKTASIPLPPGSALDLFVAVSTVTSVQEYLTMSLGSSSATGLLTTSVGNPTHLRNAYAYVERNPATTDPVSLTSELQRTLALQLNAAGQVGANGGTTSMWWTLDIAPFPTDPFGSSAGDGIEFNVINDQVAPDILVQTLGGNSILAVYTLIIVTLGGLIRGLFVLPVERVPYYEMEQVLDLLELCDGIRLAYNEVRFQRHLENEMYLYRLLLRLHRSPEVLLRITKLYQRPDDDVEADDYGQTVV